MPSCFRLFEQLDRRADSRAVCTAGSSKATRTPIMAITTSSSTSVNARRSEEKRSAAKRFIEPSKVIKGRERIKRLLPKRADQEHCPGTHKHFSVPRPPIAIKRQGVQRPVLPSRKNFQNL